jgi:hypothetical protein
MIGGLDSSSYRAGTFCTAALFCHFTHHHFANRTEHEQNDVGQNDTDLVGHSAD